MGNGQDRTSQVSCEIINLVYIYLPLSYLKTSFRTVSQLKPIDLQLPTKYEKHLPSITSLEEKIEKKIEPVREPEVKNKWIPVSDEQSKWVPIEQSNKQDEPESVEATKKEPDSAEIKQESSSSTGPPLGDPEDNPVGEKVVSLKLSSKKDKPIAFKKRKVADNVQLRERKDY